MAASRRPPKKRSSAAANGARRRGAHGGEQRHRRAELEVVGRAQDRQRARAGGARASGACTRPGVDRAADGRGRPRLRPASRCRSARPSRCGRGRAAAGTRTTSSGCACWPPPARRAPARRRRLRLDEALQVVRIAGRARRSPSRRRSALRHVLRAVAEAHGRVGRDRRHGRVPRLPVGAHRRQPLRLALRRGWRARVRRPSRSNR